MRIGGAKKRRDKNEAEIIKAWRGHGIQVWQIHVPGFADVITKSSRHGWLPVEIKSERGKLTKAQEAVRSTVEIPTVRTVEDALRLFGYDWL